MANKDALQKLYKIADSFYKNGKYGLERISLICNTIKQVFFANKFNHFNTLKEIHNLSDANIRNILKEVYSDLSSIFNEEQIRELVYYVIELIKNYPSKDIAQAIQQLIDNDIKASGLIPTDEFSIRIMQGFAKKMSNGYYIDPCVGTGRLLAGLNAKDLIGYDINSYCKDIADTYLNLLENKAENTRFSLKLSTENFLYMDLRFSNSIVGRTFVFDPPLNDTLELYGEMYQNLSANNIYSANNNIPSEYAFLSKILFSVPDKENTSFICVFANNFLSAQDKFKMTFRRYLMNNSLIAVIQSNFSENNKIQKLILVGKNRLDNPHNSLRYFITPKDKNISEDDISKIVQKCLNNETFDEKEFYNIAKIKAYTLQEIRENDYQISMPQYFEDEINPNKIKSLAEIVEELKELNNKLVNTTNFLENLTSNLLEGIKNIQESNIEEPDIQSQNISETLQKNESVNKWFDDEYSDLNNAIGIFSNDKVLDWTPIDFKNTNNIYVDDIYSCVYNLKLLYKAKRLRYRNGFLEIYSKENLDSYQEIKNFSDYIIEDNQNNDYIITMLNNISTKQIDIFNAFIKLHFDDENVFDKFTTSDVHSAIATFKVLGLLYVLPNVDNELEKYFPYIPLLNIKEEY